MSETNCHNSTNNSTYISISCSLPVIILNGKDMIDLISNEVVTKICMSSPHTTCEKI